MSLFFRSGTDEEYTEREQILQDVKDLFEDKDRLLAAKKRETAKSSASVDIRKAAMETLKCKLVCVKVCVGDRKSVV